MHRQLYAFFGLFCLLVHDLEKPDEMRTFFSTARKVRMNLLVYQLPYVCYFLNDQAVLFGIVEKFSQCVLKELFVSDSLQKRLFNVVL